MQYFDLKIGQMISGNWHRGKKWTISISQEPNDKSLTLGPDSLAAGPPEPEPGLDVPVSPLCARRHPWHH